MTSHGCIRLMVPTHAKHLTGQHPPHQTNGQSSLVVARDGKVHMFQGRVSITECDHRNIDVRGFSNGLWVEKHGSSKYTRQCCSTDYVHQSFITKDTSKSSNTDQILFWPTMILQTTEYYNYETQHSSFSTRVTKFVFSRTLQGM